MPNEPTSTYDRRNFLLSSAGLGAAGLAAMSQQAISAESSPREISIQPGDTVLFQGDSITDAGRKRDLADQPNQQAPMGGGYAWMAASHLLVSRPEDDLTFYNRGISGHKVYQLADRWEQDTLALKPDVLSILIGVNDIWHTLNGTYDGTVEKYESDYHELVERTRQELPEVQLIICEPFVLRCGVIDEKWFPEFDHYRAVAQGVAKSADATFVPFQAMFGRAVEFAPPEHWAEDGVHPSPYGAALMAHSWLKAVSA